ncbi:elongation of very long chain fatty acids protein, partial [Trichonephila clavata]
MNDSSVDSMSAMTLVALMKETLESGDPIIRSWFLVDSYYLPFLCSLMYVLAVKRVGPSLMENRKPFDLRYVMIAYNFLIVFTYISCLLL